tara:strand:+ start:159 stop:3137 length:2979 start_codon:yes stop_codon:yes gene_type:complete
MEFSTDKKSNFYFHELMSHRVHEILLVASPYDAFILEEDGRLTEQIITEYLGMNFNYAPRLTRASTAADAIHILNDKTFDLVIVMLRIEDRDPISLGKAIKELYPKMPVILLAFDETELKRLTNQITPNSIDRVFIWSGDASVFPAIIKYVEDRKNAHRDIIKGDVRAIIIIEDSPRMYSILLPLIYREIMYLTKNLMNKSLNNTQRLLHLRGRLKVLLTPNYETAEKFVTKYGNNIVGIISDVRFPRNGTKNPTAGVEFAKWVRSIHPSMPVMLQSTDLANHTMAEAIGADFLHKNSSTLLQDLRDFIITNFGFGDFTFRLEDGQKIYKATNIEELIKGIEEVQIESILFHGRSNHFSNWLAARSEFNLASRLRPLDVNQYESGEDVRSILLKQMRFLNNQPKFGHIVDYTRGLGKKGDAGFYRLCGGSLGGKARGLAFARQMIKISTIQETFPEIKISVPQAAIIGTDEFDQFMKDNNLWEKALKTKDDSKLNQLFIDSRLSLDLILKLESFLEDATFPLAIRSSSLLEDSQYQPLAGAYSTFMLANNQPRVIDRVKALRKTIKLVFASTFNSEAKSHLNNTAHRTEEEKMAVMIMEIVGQNFSTNRFYPTMSGVLKSINYYPVSYMKRDEGVAYLALGFGRTIVDGGKCLSISPKYPSILPQFSSIKSTIQNSQSHFFGLPMNESVDVSNKDLELFSLSCAEDDGVLKWVGSVISSEDNILRDSTSYKGTRVVTFSPILNWNIIPLTEILNELLSMGKAALGCPIEIEFAVNIFPDQRKKPELYLLQIKPMVLTGLRSIQLEPVNKQEIFCQSQITLGNGIYNNIYDLVYVRPTTFDSSKSHNMSLEIESINKEFKTESSYILAGPGRWGSADPWLGIPVGWNQITNAQVIIEIGHEELPVDPSFGSHFFQNLTNLHIGYFTIDNKKDDFIDDAWLKDQSLKKKGEYVDWYQFKNPFKVAIDGLSGSGTITKPTVPAKKIMDEEESSGI